MQKLCATTVLLISLKLHISMKALTSAISSSLAFYNIAFVKHVLSSLCCSRLNLIFKQ